MSEAVKNFLTHHGDPAFPFVAVSQTDKKTGAILANEIFPGMSLRDWFAGQALIEFSSLVTISAPETFDVVAQKAYLMADAMIAARKAGA